MVASFIPHYIHKFVNISRAELHLRENDFSGKNRQDDLYASGWVGFDRILLGRKEADMLHLVPMPVK
jgi:hypothetical protein